VNLLFLGPPGAGKGTQSRLLSSRLGIPQISTGDMLRAVIASNSALGHEANRLLSKGDLVPDEVMIGIVGERLRQPDAASGFILDGFPRTIAQAQALDTVLISLGRQLDRVIFFDIAEEALIKRLSGRRVCRSAGHIYNIHYNPPKRDGVCDLDGSEVYARDDDRPETVRHRIKIYREQTEPLLAFYQARSLFTAIRAQGNVDEITDALLAALPLSKKAKS
jgi:adenylate kinase